MRRETSADCLLSARRQPSGLPAKRSERTKSASAAEPPRMQETPREPWLSPQPSRGSHCGRYPERARAAPAIDSRVSDMSDGRWSRILRSTSIPTFTIRRRLPPGSDLHHPKTASTGPISTIRRRLRPNRSNRAPSTCLPRAPVPSAEVFTSLDGHAPCATRGSRSSSLRPPAWRRLRRRASYTRCDPFRDHWNRSASRSTPDPRPPGTPPMAEVPLESRCRAPLSRRSPDPGSPTRSPRSVMNAM